MSKELDSHISKLYAEIAEATKKPDLPAIQRLARKVAELEDLKQQQVTIQQRVEKLILDDTTASGSAFEGKADGKYRELPVQVSEGMICQNLLTLTPHIKRGRIRIGEELTIEALPSGERFQTHVLDKGNKLRARGEIARFYKDIKVRPDEFVVLTEISPGHWTLRKARPGEYNAFPA